MISLRSKITQALLGYFFLHEDAKLYINEMARRFHLDSGNLTKKLDELETQGLLKSEWQGAQRYYALNPQFPLYKEYKQIVQKTLGFPQRLKAALENLAGIKEVFIFGSFAENTMDEKSDIDVMAIGAHSTLDLQKKTAVLQKELDREINCVNMSPAEYEKKKDKDPFLKTILRKKRIKVI